MERFVSSIQKVSLIYLDIGWGLDRSSVKQKEVHTYWDEKKMRLMDIADTEIFRDYSVPRR